MLIKKNDNETGAILKNSREEILKVWEKKVRKEVTEASDLSRPILIDTLPAILDNLADKISVTKNPEKLSIDSTLAQEHGGERARMTTFNISALILEFRILRNVIFEVLHEKGAAFDSTISYMIHSFIDDAIQASATSFSLIQANLREHVMATLTHDMRSPLTAASLAAQLIAKKSTDPFIINQAKKISLNHRKIDGMIHDLLNTTLLKSGGRLNLQIEEVDFLILINELMEELGGPQTERIKCYCKSTFGYWDKGHLKRAMENLVANAFKYGDPDKEITITIESTNDRLVAKVHNFGPPIPKEEQEAIFQIFRRAETAKVGKRPGWGLGLPIVRSVAEAHGGSLNLMSKKDTGTTFIIDIPVDARPHQDAPQSG